MDSSLCFTVNRPKVIYEILDGELVMINLDTGNYYTMDGVGADIWTMVEDGHPVAQIILGLVERYQGDSKLVTEAVNAFIAKLEDEELIIRDQCCKNNNLSDPASANTQPRENLQQPGFSWPTLQKYSDMQELLLLDPIHEVDDTGWPNPKVNS
jgi:Coenzyme PQQ synthesis protein D (PqqD)